MNDATHTAHTSKEDERGIDSNTDATRPSKPYFGTREKQSDYQP
jgi:hypothetical protein